MIRIIGGGPAGCHIGSILAKSGRDVTIHEEHEKIGLPVQCTGILSNKLNEITKPKREYITNIVNRVRIIGPDKELELKIHDNYIVDRKRFDSYWANKAEESGAKIQLSSKFISGNENKIKVKSKNTRIFKFSHLIGADGPLSDVAKNYGMYGNRQFMIGHQVRAKYQNDNIVEFYPHIGCFAWVVPENKETTRIGVASYNSPKQDLSILLKRLNIKKSIENQSGIIPIFNPKISSQLKNISLLGDAATQVKATTGGGIIQGFRSGQILSQCIAQNKNYNLAWKRKIGPNLLTHLAIRKIMDQFTSKDWNQLIEDFSEESLRTVLEKEERDDILNILPKLFLRKPSLIKHARHSGKVLNILKNLV